MANLTTSARMLPTNSFLRNFLDTDSFFGKFMDKWWDTATPAVNIAEKENEYVMEMAVPGFGKDDIKIDVENNVLTVKAEAKKETSEEKKEYTRKEYNFSSFSHSYHIPDNVRDNEITATHKDGVLTLVLPKTNQQVTATKSITIN